MVRLQKYIAQCGVASRRAAEVLIAEGKIKVNGEIVTEMGVQIDPKVDKVEFQGVIITQKEENIYLLLNKPKGYITTRKDTHGRQTIYDLFPARYGHLVPAGRLDMDTTGLLILSNDGDFIYQITHPSFELEKEYCVRCRGLMGDEIFEKLEQGVMIEERKTFPAKISRISRGKNVTDFNMTIHEGRKRQVRLMCRAVGSHVLALKRVRVGSLALGELPEGQFRSLLPRELEDLLKYL